MPFNGSGVFQRVRNWVADATAGIKIRADYHDNEDDGFAAGLTNCITKDGQTIITQNIPFNSKRVTGLADPINPQDASTKAYADTKMPAAGGVPMTGDLVITKTYPTLTLNAPDGTAAGIEGQNNGLQRWWMRLGNGEPETGTEAGSNFDLHRYNDDGTYLGQVLKFTRATGYGLVSGGFNVVGELTAGYASSDSHTGKFNVVGGSAAGGGGIVAFSKDNTSNWFVAHYSAIYGAGSSNNSLVVYNTHAGQCVHFEWSDASVTFAKPNIFKPGGGPFYDSSDARIKNVLGDYTNGLAAIAALNPVRYTFKGNDTKDPPTGAAPYEASPHAAVAKDGTEFIGLIAQQVEAAMPELVNRKTGFIDGVEVADLRNIDGTALTYAFINAFRELKARVEALETGGAR